MSRSYLAKVLLFGEHVVLRGGRGLAVPYPGSALRWERRRPDERLLALADYLRTELTPGWLDHDRLERELRVEGWRLEGDVPEGYGLGSSGAVCAAVWDRYGTAAGRRLDGEALRQALASMEQHFHGRSSGTDPLVSLLNKPLVLGGAASPTVVRLGLDWRDVFELVDTGKPRSAAPLIETFLRRWDTDDDFRARAQGQWLGASNRAITALLSGDRVALATAFRTVAAFQNAALPEFFPPPQRHRGLKLCGAGGGGMLLKLRGD